MKWIGLIAIFIGCSLVGYLMDYLYRKRIKELQALSEAFAYLKSEVDYFLTPLGEACYKTSQQAKENVGVLFEAFGKSLDEKQETNLKTMWEAILQKHKKDYALQKEDYEVLEHFGALVVAYDKQTQVYRILQLINQLEKRYEQLEKEQANKSKLYTGMGMLVGACLCLIII